MTRRWRCGLALAMALAFAACTSTPPAPPAPPQGLNAPMGPASRHDARALILVTMRNPDHAALTGGADVSTTPLPAAYAALLRQWEAQYGLKRVADWALRSLPVRCMVFEVAAGRSRDSVLRELAQAPLVETAQPLQEFNVLADEVPPRSLRSLPPEGAAPAWERPGAGATPACDLASLHLADLGAVRLRRQHQAGAGQAAVDGDAAGAAVARRTAFLTASQIEFIAQDIELAGAPAERARTSGPYCISLDFTGTRLYVSDLRRIHARNLQRELPSILRLAHVHRGRPARGDRGHAAHGVLGLALLVGADPGPLPAKAPFDETTVLAELRAGLPSELLVSRPDIISAEHQLRASNAHIGAARAAFLPRIALTGSFGTASSDLNGLFDSGSRAWTFMPTLSLPIFDGGRRRANLELSEVRRDIAVAGYEKTIQTAFREVADALSAKHWLAEQLTIQRANLEAQSERARLAKLRYDNGSAAFLEVLDAQRDLLGAQQQLVQARRALLSSQVALYAALGGGTLAAAGEAQGAASTPASTPSTR